MEYTHILLRYGELFLKGKNRLFFENRLASNVNKMVGVRVQRTQGRLIVPYFFTIYLDSVPKDFVGCKMEKSVYISANFRQIAVLFLLKFTKIYTRFLYFSLRRNL